jgi:raffinose/stachyose/melibiose transport system permease protein
MAGPTAAPVVGPSTSGPLGRRQLAPSRRHRGLGERATSLVLITPVLILFAVSAIYPLFETIRLSFFDIKGMNPAKYVGIGNYLTLFSDPGFRGTLVTTVIFTLATTAVSVTIGWVLAMLCAFAPRQTAPFRVMIFMAFGISETVSGYRMPGLGTKIPPSGPS